MEHEFTQRSRAASSTVEVLHESGLTRISRYVTSDGSSVIHKEPLGSGALLRARHELRILRRLAAVGAQPWVRSDGILDVAAQVAFAATLASMFAGVHREGVVHRDLTPANILVSIESHGENAVGENIARPVLIDFHLATTFAEVAPGFSHPSDSGTANDIPIVKAR